jgi:hypothetical protein
VPPTFTGKEIGGKFFTTQLNDTPDDYDFLYIADQFTVARNGCMNLALAEARLLKDDHAEPRQLARLKIERAKFQLRATATVLFKKLTGEGFFTNKGHSNTPTKIAISDFEDFFLGAESGVWKSIEEAYDVLRAETLHLKVQANRGKVDLDLSRKAQQILSTKGTCTSCFQKLACGKCAEEEAWQAQCEAETSAELKEVSTDIDDPPIEKCAATAAQRWNVFESTGVWEETASSVKLHAKRAKVTSRSIRTLREEEGSSDITEEKTRESEADTLFRIEKICRDITEETPNLSEDELARKIIERFTLSAEGSQIRTRWGIDGLDNSAKLLAEKLIEVPKKGSKKKKKKAARAQKKRALQQLHLNPKN